VPKRLVVLFSELGMRTTEMTSAEGGSEPGPETEAAGDEADRAGSDVLRTADWIGLVLVLAVLAELGATLTSGLQEYSGRELGVRTPFWQVVPEMTAWANLWTGTLLLAVLAVVVAPRWWLSADRAEDVPARAWGLVLVTCIVGVLGIISVVLQAVSYFEIGFDASEVGIQVGDLLLIGCATLLSFGRLMSWRLRAGGAPCDTAPPV
jgi:hypothetical protein